jgi:hypothetical protein
MLDQVISPLFDDVFPERLPILDARNRRLVHVHRVTREGRTLAFILLEVLDKVLP